MNLGERIQHARKLAGISQPELALRCGWETGSRIGNYEQGTREPVLSDIKKIADALADTGITYPWLVLGDDAQQFPVTVHQSLSKLIRTALDTSSRDIPALLGLIGALALIGSPRDKRLLQGLAADLEKKVPTAPRHQAHKRR